MFVRYPGQRMWFELGAEVHITLAEQFVPGITYLTYLRGPGGREMPLSLPTGMISPVPEGCRANERANKGRTGGGAEVYVSRG